MVVVVCAYCSIAGCCTVLKTRWGIAKWLMQRGLVGMKGFHAFAAPRYDFGLMGRRETWGRLMALCVADDVASNGASAVRRVRCSCQYVTKDTVCVRIGHMTTDGAGFLGLLSSMVNVDENPEKRGEVLDEVLRGTPSSPFEEKVSNSWDMRWVASLARMWQHGDVIHLVDSASCPKWWIDCHSDGSSRPTHLLHFVFRRDWDFDWNRNRNWNRIVPVCRELLSPRHCCPILRTSFSVFPTEIHSEPEPKSKPKPKPETGSGSGPERVVVVVSPTPTHASVTTSTGPL